MKWHVLFCLYGLPSLTSSRHECWVCDGWEVKQPLHSRFIFEDINDGKIAIMTSLDFSNESVKNDPLYVCNFDLNFSNFFKSYV